MLYQLSYARPPLSQRETSGNEAGRTGLWATSDLCVEAGWGGGGEWPYFPRKITQCPKAFVVPTHSNRRKQTFTILASIETVIIPKIVILKPCILYGLVQENFKPALFRATTKTVLVFVCFASFVIVFVDSNNIHLVDFQDICLNDVGPLQNTWILILLIWL